MLRADGLPECHPLGWRPLLRYKRAMRARSAVLVLFGLTLLWRCSGQAQEADGEALYLRHCASCHGNQGRGDGPDARAFGSAPRDLRDGVLRRYGSEELVERVLQGRKLLLALDPDQMRQHAADVESLISYLRRLAQANWALIEKGWNLYSSRCVQCHGVYGKPPAQLPKGVAAARDLATAEFQKSVNDAALHDAVRHGRQGMPALTPQVSGGDARALAGFVRLLSPGFETYQRYCATCHGDDGRGERTPGSAEAHPQVAFDRAFFASRDPEALRTQVWHMLREKKPAMPHFRDQLEPPQARAIVDFLKRAEP